MMYLILKDNSYIATPYLSAAHTEQNVGHS